MWMRLLLFVAVAAIVFVPLNVVVYRQLCAIHPARKRWIRLLLVAGNLIWPVIPLLQASNPFTRAARAVFGPIWFGWIAFCLLYATFLFVVLLVWLPFRRRTRFAAFARRPSQLLLALLLTGFVAGYYQAIVPLRVESVTVALPALPDEANGMRLALLGDLHVGLFTRHSRLEKIFRTSAELQPDAILIAGDLIDDDPAFVPKLLEGARHVTTGIPILAVPGNHEMYGDPDAVIAATRGSRIELLVNAGRAIRSVWIAGVSDPSARQMPGRTHLVPDLAASLTGRAPGEIPIVFAHQPKVLDEAVANQIPLVLCAHTHGGQLGFRPLGWSLAGVFLPYHMGLYRIAGTQLYVNTGTGYWLFPFRLGMTPEITLIELVRG